MAGFSSDVEFKYPFGTLDEGHNEFKMEVHRRGILYDKKRMLKQSSMNAAKPNEEIHESEFFGPDDHFEGNYFDESSAIMETKVRDPTNYNLREMKRSFKASSHLKNPPNLGEEPNSSNTPPVTDNNKKKNNQKESKRKAGESDCDSTYSKKSQTKAKSEKNIQTTPSSAQKKSENKKSMKDKNIKKQTMKKNTINIDCSDDSSSDSGLQTKKDANKIPKYVQKLLEVQKKEFEKILESQKLHSEKEINNLKKIVEEKKHDQRPTTSARSFYY